MRNDVLSRGVRTDYVNTPFFQCVYFILCQIGKILDTVRRVTSRDYGLFLFSLFIWILCYFYFIYLFIYLKCSPAYFVVARH